jgi:hypothetical protein
MQNTATFTASQASTMTDARVRTVMRKVDANLSTLVTRGLITEDRAAMWSWALTYLQILSALESFEVQFTIYGRQFGLRYTVSADGTVRDDASSGGLDVYGIPPNTPTGIVLSLKSGTSQIIYDELERRGWGMNGRSLSGVTSNRRAFSSDGYGIVREHIGEWL